MGRFLKGGVAIVAAITCSTSVSSIARPLPAALEQLARDGQFSGAIATRGADGVRFARGFGPADPFTGRRFTPDTPVDSASLAKTVTSAAVLMLARDGKLDLDAPVSRYLAEYPDVDATVRHLLAHSAGLPPDSALEPIVGKTNAMLLAEIRQRNLPPLFPPGSAFNYCNLCFVSLALLVERVSGQPLLRFARERLALPPGVTIRPARLADWRGRAIGYRRNKDGELERADSYDNELFYGTANLSITANQLARWGAQWWKPPLASLTALASEPAVIAGKASGLSLGNWYCAPTGRRCHYLGHHEGFHHMLYWDADRKISAALVTNNTLEPGMHQRVQRALVAFAERRPESADRELSRPLPGRPVVPATYRLGSGEIVTVTADGERVSVIRGGISYRAYRLGQGIRYVPGLDLYVAGAGRGRLHWLGLYEDEIGTRVGVLR